MPSTETLLLVLLSTGLLMVLVLMSAVLWVVLTILFRVRHDLKSETGNQSSRLLDRVERLTSQLKAARTEDPAALGPLIHEGTAVMQELEKQTKELAQSQSDSAENH